MLYRHLEKLLLNHRPGGHAWAVWGGGREWQVGISGCRQGLSAPRGSCAGGVDLQGGYYVPEDATAVPEEDALRLPSSDPQVQLRRPTRPRPLHP